MASPITSNMGIPSCSVMVGGKDMGATYGIKSIVVTKEINKVSKARIIIMDGNPSDETFDASASKDFDPDKVISIKMGYNQKEQEVWLPGSEDHAENNIEYGDVQQWFQYPPDVAKEEFGSISP